MQDEYFCPHAGHCPAYVDEGDGDRISARRRDRVTRTEKGYLCSALIRKRNKTHGDPNFPECLLIKILNKLEGLD